MIEKILESLEGITVSRSEEGIINGCNMGVCEDDDCLKCLKKKIIQIVQEVAKEEKEDIDWKSTREYVEERYFKPIMELSEKYDYPCKDIALDFDWVFGLIKKIENCLSKDGGWIPCSERLPDIGERVLLWVYGQVHIGKRIDAKLFEEYDIFSLENKTNESTKRIEAWKPLDAPYQKGE